jgi:hypothetical protein
MRRDIAVLCGLVLVLVVAYAAYAWTPLDVDTDPLVRMPGTQPAQGVSLEPPGRCLNCHADYDASAEPGRNWKGSMMAQSARDFLFWACMTVAGQDSIWAVGTPDAVDICERCHFPKGWLEGRSDPPNASAMTGADFDGVQCDFCHTMFDPFFDATYAGTREGSDWAGYWDETNASDTPSQPAASATYQEDQSLAQAITYMNGAPFYSNDLPPVGYQENGGGQYFVSSGGEKRASFADAEARHQMFYSRYHKSKYFCSTCHDVSNPVLANLGADPAQPLPTEQTSAYAYYHVERTYSEFMLSAYGQQGGSATNPAFQAQGATGITHAAKCQDCHMHDVVGAGADMNNAPIRPGDSVEHPNSGEPLHDMTGGNAWVSYVLASAVPGSPNYDATNDALLAQGSALLTLDLGQGEGIDPEALLAGVDRAKQQLRLAATLTDLEYNSSSGALSFHIQNNAGHKLISGFPEGRRMFVNIRAYAGGSLIYEVNPYDAAAGTLIGLAYPYQPGMGLPTPRPLGAGEAYVDQLVYEMKPSSQGLTGEDKTFHFALATGRYKDNRIPPKGYHIDAAAERLSVPVWHGVEDASYFSGAEYAGGYDAVSLDIPGGADHVEVNLYYQTTSREYVEFLRDEINGTGSLTLSSPAPSGEPGAYIVQSDPFFAQLRAWGDTLWELWTHNVNVDGAAPFLMVQATLTTSPLAAPALVSPANGAVLDDTTPTLAWTAVTGATGYMLDWNGAVSDVGDVTSHTTPVLVDGTYSWTVSAYDENGNHSPYPAAWSLTVDATPPAVPALISPANGAVLDDTTPTLAWSAVGDATGYMLDWNGAVSDVGDVNSFTTPVLASGTYTWTVATYDAVGNTSAYASPWSLTVDTTVPITAPPVPVLLAHADGAVISDTTPTVSWLPSAGATGYYLNWNGVVTDVGAVTAYTTPLLADGKYVWTVAAYDGDSRVSEYAGPRSLTVDATQPHVSAVLPEPAAVALPSVTLAITFSEPIQASTFAYTVVPDPGGWNVGWHPNRRVVALAHAPFDSGTTYTVMVYAADLAGNHLPGEGYTWSFTSRAYLAYLPLVMRSEADSARAAAHSTIESR